MWIRNCQENYQTNSSNLIWNCFDIWNSGRKAKNRVEMTEPKSSNLSVNEKLSRNLPNQVQQLDLRVFWYMEFKSKSQKQCQNDGTQVQQLDCEWKILKKCNKPSPATWFEIGLIYGIQVEEPKTEVKWRNPSPATWVWLRNSHEIHQTKSSNLIWKCFDIWNSCRKAENRVEMTEPKSSNLSVNEKLSRNVPNQVQQLDLKLFWYMEFRSKSRKQSWNDGTQVQQLECDWEILMKFTKPSPATWFENVLIYGIQVKKPKTKSKWRNPSPATWMCIRNCQEIYQTNSSNLIWNCFDISNSGRKAKNRVEMTEPKSSNLSVNEKLSRNLPNQVQQLDLRVFWYMEFKSKSQKQCQNDGTQVQQLECDWEILMKFTKPSPATWFENVLIYGIHVEKPKTELKWRNPSPATWVWMRNCQEMYQTKSSNLIWNCFDIWNSGRRAENRVEMTEPKSSNLSVIEKFSWNSPNQVQQLDLKMFWYMEFKSKSQKQSQNDGIQVQQLECV